MVFGTDVVQRPRVGGITRVRSVNPHSSSASVGSDHAATLTSRHNGNLDHGCAVRWRQCRKAQAKKHLVGSSDLQRRGQVVDTTRQHDVQAIGQLGLDTVGCVHVSAGNVNRFARVVSSRT